MGEKADFKFDYADIFLDIGPCSNRCFHCWANLDNCKEDAGYTSLEEIEEVMKQVSELRKKHLPDESHLYFNVLYDFFEYPEFIRLAELMLSSSVGKTEVIATNGVGIVKQENPEEALSQMKQRGLETLQLTLYGVQDNHDRYAGRKGAYKDIIDCAKFASGVDIPTNWCYMLTNTNLSDLEKVIEATQGIGRHLPHRFRIQIPDLEGTAVKSESTRPTVQQFQSLPEELRSLCYERLYTEREVMKEVEEKQPPKKDRIFSIEIGPNFEVFYNQLVFDLMKKEQVANLREKDLTEIARHYHSRYDLIHGTGYDPAELAQLYGDPANDKVYSKRDIIRKWVREHVKKEQGFNLELH